MIRNAIKCPQEPPESGGWRFASWQGCGEVSTKPLDHRDRHAIRFKSPARMKRIWFVIDYLP